jgi:hypothetical protein
VRLNPDLTRPSPTSKFTFTPGNVAALDQNDRDLSAGGVMLLPQSVVPDMAVATSKDGQMFLLNRDDLGGFTPTDTGVLGEVNIGDGCWCGTSYFNDGSPHIVSSGGTFASGTWGLPPAHNSLGLWNLQTSPKPNLTQSASGNLPDTIQDPGFFTTVSSNGTNNPIIWAVARPQTNSQNPTIWLYAFKGTPSGSTLSLLFKAAAGSWPNVAGNANIVPVVANGKVYVASYKELDIFGLGLHGALTPKARAKALVQVPGPQFVVKGPEEHQVSGIVRKVEGNHLTIETRDKKTVEVDVTEAKRLFHYAAGVGEGRSVIAAYSIVNGVWQAKFVMRAKAPATWPPDR